MKRIFLTGYALLMIGCTTSPEITAWNMAQEVNTPAAYEDFIRRYPQSGHTDDAREMIGKSKMDQIMKASTVAECVRTMKTDPDPKTAATVASLAFKAAQTETSAEALYDFLAYFRNHEGAPKIRIRLEEIEFNKAKEDPSAVPMEYFLLKYPDSNFAREGQNILAEKSYKLVKAWKNQYGFKAFLQKFPLSSHASEVKALIKPENPQPAASNVELMLASAIEKSPWLKRYGCALSLSATISKKAGDVDSLGRELFVLEKGGASGALPEACSSVRLAARDGAGSDLAEALRMMAKTEERRKELANIWEAYRQRDNMAKTAADASARVADDLEAAELSEDVLGSGPLGALDAGREKGSATARKAYERFKLAGKTIGKDRDDIKRLLLDMDSLYRPLRFYLSNSIVAEQFSGGKP